MLILLLTLQGDSGSIGLMGAPGPKGEKGDPVSKILLFCINGHHGWHGSHAYQPGYSDEQVWTESLMNASTECIQAMGQSTSLFHHCT